MTQHHTPRYIPLCPNGNPTPILYIDANAPLDELQAFAEQRVRSVAQVLESLSLVSGESLEGRDLAYIAHLAARVLEEGCEVMAVMQKRLAQQAT
jgi:hypothetical protein